MGLAFTRLVERSRLAKMDIHFSCPACEHHMVIDEAGAGLVIQCTECGQDVRVPNPVEPKPSPEAGPANVSQPAPANVSQPDKERTVALKWTPPTGSPQKEPKK